MTNNVLHWTEEQPKEPGFYWMKDKGIDLDWIDAHKSEIADALDSFLIGDVSHRKDVESMLEMLPDDKKKEWKEQRQDRHRSSLNKIGERAYELAESLRGAAQ